MKHPKPNPAPETKNLFSNPFEGNANIFSSSEDARIQIVSLDAKTTSSLDWKPQIEAARCHIASGYTILWDLQFGLFKNLQRPLSDSTQLLSLTLAIEHFAAIIWDEFKESTAGARIYCGPIEFYRAWSSDSSLISSLHAWLQKNYHSPESLEQELEISTSSLDIVTPETLALLPEGKRLLTFFSHSIAIDYFHLLQPHFPRELKIFLQLHSDVPHSLLDKAFLSNPEHYAPFETIFTGSITSQSNTPFSPLGVCLPPLELCLPGKFPELASALNFLAERNIPYRFISEERLIVEWEGLDELIVCNHNLSPQTRRKLLGFASAAGSIITVGDIPIGIDREIPFSQFFQRFT